MSYTYMPIAKTSKTAPAARPAPAVLPALSQLQEALLNQDWYYAHSDDHTVWRQGNANMTRVHELMRAARAAGLGAEADALYAHCAK